MGAVGPKISPAVEVHRLAMAWSERNNALAMWLQSLSDRWREFGGSIPCDATLFSSFPSAPIHPMERNRYCKEKSPFCNRSSSSVGKGIFDAPVGAGTAGGETEGRRRKLVPHRDAWVMEAGSNVETHNCIDGGRDLPRLKFPAQSFSLSQPRRVEFGDDST